MYLLLLYFFFFFFKQKTAYELTYGDWSSDVCSSDLPKLIPPFQSTAASGTFPIEQTKDSIATTGPTTGPQNNAATGCWTRKKRCQNSFGTQAPSAPASSRPPAMSRQTAAQSMTK